MSARRWKMVTTAFWALRWERGAVRRVRVVITYRQYLKGRAHR